MGIKVPAKYKKMEFAALLLEMVRLFNPRVYVEYGVQKGYTINQIAPLVEKAIGVDIEVPEYLHPSIEFYKMKTSEFQKKWAGKIDFLFIDADHSADAVFYDLMDSFPFFIPMKTLIFIHDTYPIKKALLADGYCSDGWRTAKHVHQNHKNFEIVTLPGPWAGLSILRYLGQGNRHGWMDKEML